MESFLTSLGTGPSGREMSERSILRMGHFSQKSLHLTGEVTGGYAALVLARGRAEWRDVRSCPKRDCE